MHIWAIRNVITAKKEGLDMPATASLEELAMVSAKIQELERSFPEACKAFSTLIKENRKVGYKNICKLLLGEATPKELKGI